MDVQVDHDMIGLSLLTLRTGHLIQTRPGSNAMLGDVEGKAGLAQERTLPFGQQRCWEILNCPLQARAVCAASQRPDIPCWVARQIAGQHLPGGCGTCPVRTLF